MGGNWASPTPGFCFTSTCRSGRSRRLLGPETSQLLSNQNRPCEARPVPATAHWLPFSFTLVWNLSTTVNVYWSLVSFFVCECVCVFVSLLVQTRFQFDVQRFRSDPTSSRTRFVSLSRVAEASQSSEDLEPGGNVQVSLQTSNPQQQQALKLECEFVWWRFLYHLSCEEQEVRRNIWKCFSLHRKPSRLAPHSGILKHSETGQHSGRCCHVFYVCS